MKSLRLFTLALICLVMAGTAVAQEVKPGTIGVRAGIGTDISGGIAYGIQLGYTMNQLPNGLEMGLALFGGKFEEDSNNGFNDYHEETTVFVIGAMVNYLFRWGIEMKGPYFLAGVGVGAVSVEWTESSPTDTSLGPPLPGGGSSQSEEGTTGGLILNFGIGGRFNEKFDLRFQVPTMFIGGGDERDGAVVPMFMLTAGLQFG